VRLPKQSLIEAGVKEGDRLEIAIEKDGEIRLSAARPKLTLEGLVSQITNENSHELVDWGGPQGKEVW
jgi:antitoxin MazE